MFAVVFVRKGHLKVTQKGRMPLVNKHIMEKKETNKVTKAAKMEAKPLQGEKSASPNSRLQMATYMGR